MEIEIGDSDGCSSLWEMSSLKKEIDIKNTLKLMNSLLVDYGDLN